MIRIDDELAIPEEELSFSASRSGGPGGQNVNKVETRVTLRFDVAGSPSLSQRQRELLRERLASRISRAGLLQVTAQRHRTQAANREAATERFVELVADALRESEVRRRTRVPRAARERRLQTKALRGRRKRERAASVSRE
ncbi:MAG TPA: alternative ribosome rescue aminoacyl-tRNA hydrolase ArfB [Thermoanaerobaculia bacterium]|nr:alternative ribosome rescue aminoacyl-tRNA hydrolase ArfB [Thermoanaerobaculia bacterium]